MSFCENRRHFPESHHHFLTSKQIAFTKKKLWEPSYQIHRGNLHRSTLRLEEDDYPDVALPTLYQTNFKVTLNSSERPNPAPGRTVDTKQRKNKSHALQDLMTLDDPDRVSYPTYWTQYKMAHGKLALTLGTGQDQPKKQAPRFDIFTGEQLPKNEKSKHHLISRSQILLQERQAEQEKCISLLG